MNLINCKKFNIISPLIIGTGVLLASVFLFSFTVQAQTNADNEAQVKAAIEDLSSITGQNIISEEQAKNLCNLEQYLDICAEVGKNHNLYTKEEVKQVNDFLSEVKGKILADIKSCINEECLVKVATELAQKIKTKNPTLAIDLNLTTTVVAEKQAVVQAAKEVGVNFSDCESMDPNTAPVDLLRKCARLAKDIRVQKYIPEEKKILANQFDDDRTIKLREALSAGKYQCGDGTLEGCGNYCLNPSTTTGMAGIPPVCAQIASEIFGQEGVKQLETAHQQVGQVKDYYSKKFILTLPDGSELVGENQIRNACDKAFSKQINNLELARACGKFAVQNGFASQADVEKGLKLMESFTRKGQNVDFNKCIADPAICRDFIPEDDRNRFDVGSQIFNIMKSEIGFDPSQCERGAIDPTIGTKCFEGSKRALAKIESLGLVTQSEEAKFIVEDIRRHVARGEEFMNKKDEFNQVFSQQGGPGGCKSEAECFTYCSSSTNGPECIAFGAKQQISGFKGEEAVQKFQEYNQNLQRPGLVSDEYRPFPPGGQYPQYPGQGPYPGFQPPGQGGFPPGQFPGFTQPGPGFSSPPGVDGFYPGPGPVGPSPECFAAIQSGDFVKAKTVCYVPPPTQPFPSAQICPASPYIQCPAGEYRESYRNDDGCWVDGPCKPAPIYSPYPIYTQNQGDPNSCPWFSHSKWDKDGKRYCRLNETSSCQYDYPAYLDKINYAPSNCPTEYGGPYPTYSPYPTTPSSNCSQSLINLLGQGCHQMYTDSSGRSVFCDGPMSKSAKEGDTTTTAGCSGGGSTYSPYPTLTGVSSFKGCFYPNAIKDGKYPGYTIWCEADYYNCHVGDSSGATIDMAGLSLGAPSICASGGNTTSSPYPTYSPPIGVGNCPTGYHFHSESGGFCMNDQENYGGTCYNATGTSQITCPTQATYTPYPTYSPTSGGSCPSGSHTMYVNSAGGYCMSDSDGSKCGPLNSSSVSGFGSCSGYQTTITYSPPPGTSYTPYPTVGSCPAGQWWDYATNGCKSSTYTYTPYPTAQSCPSGQWWDYASNICRTTCPSSQYWNGSSCVDNVTTSYTPYPTTQYTPYPTTEYTPYPTTEYTPPPSCGSDQYWNGSSCVSSSPPPTSSLYPHYIIAHCQQLNRRWNGSTCEANGLFARLYENTFANVLRALRLIP